MGLGSYHKCKNDSCIYTQIKLSPASTTMPSHIKVFKLVAFSIYNPILNSCMITTVTQYVLC